MGKRSLRVRSTFTSWQVDAIADAIVVVRVNFDVVASFDDTFSLTSNWVAIQQQHSTDNCCSDFSAT